jgi:glutamate-ammonia-ligase adenylyltransferase
MILVPDTINALQKLGENKFLPLFLVKELTENYIFYRRLEHLLQLLEDRQIHRLPQEKEELEVLAKCMNFIKADDFVENLNIRLKRVREVFGQYVNSKNPIKIE